jgi:hypothetical protein
MVRKMGYKSFYDRSTFGWFSVHLFGFANKYSFYFFFGKIIFKKAIAVGEGMVGPEAIICISSVTAIPVRFVRNLWREFLAFIMIFYVFKIATTKDNFYFNINCKTTV